MSVPAADTAGVSRRVIALLRLFADGQDSLSINEISEELRLAPSTVHRLLAGLVEENIIERSARRRYCVGREFSRIGALAARKVSVRRLARPMMQNLLAATGETVLLGLVLTRPLGLTIADKLDSVHTLRYNVALNLPRPLVWGSLGRVALAWLGPDQVDAALAQAGASPGNGDPPPSRMQIAAALDAIRRDGYGMTRGQMVAGAVGLAAPIFDADERLVAVLGVTIPELRFRRRGEPRLASLVRAQAAEVSRALGWSPPPSAASRRPGFRRMESYAGSSFPGGGGGLPSPRARSPQRGGTA